MSWFRKSKKVVPRPVIIPEVRKPVSREIQDMQKRQRQLYDKIDEQRNELHGLNRWLEEHN